MLTVWLGKFAMRTHLQSRESLIAPLPPSMHTFECYMRDAHTLALPVLLMRQDFVLYPTHFELEFKFNFFKTQPRDFSMVAKYRPFDAEIQDPEIFSKTLLF